MAIDIVTAVFITAIAGVIYLSTLCTEFRPCRRLHSSVKRRRVTLSTQLNRSPHQL
jgi:hypothetical protein